MRPRQNFYLDPELLARLDALARPGVSKSAILSDALRGHLARLGARELDDLLKTRMENLSRQLNRIEKDQQIVMESLALFIRYQLTVTAHLPEFDKGAMAIAQDRFRALIDQVARRIATGRSLSKDLLRSLAPEAAE